MEPIVRVPYPHVSSDAFERDLAEVLAAIRLVAERRAERVSLVSLRDGEGVAGLALARATAAHVAFSVGRTDRGDVRLIIGPRLVELRATTR